MSSLQASGFTKRTTPPFRSYSTSVCFSSGWPIRPSLSLSLSVAKKAMFLNVAPMNSTCGATTHPLRTSFPATPLMVAPAASLMRPLFVAAIRDRLQLQLSGELAADAHEGRSGVDEEVSFLTVDLERDDRPRTLHRHWDGQGALDRARRGGWSRAKQPRHHARRGDRPTNSRLGLRAAGPRGLKSRPRSLPRRAMTLHPEQGRAAGALQTWGRLDPPGSAKIFFWLLAT